MALITVFNRLSPSLGAFQFDAVLEDRFEMSLEFPDYPIETGARVVDHRVIKPLMYSITGAVSNNPLIPISAEDLILGGITNALSRSGLGSMLPSIPASFLAGGNETRASSALEFLVQMAANAMPMDVDAVDIQLQNMVIENIRRTRDPENENGLIFIADLRELITVDRLNQRIGTNPDNMPDGDPVKTAAGTVNNRGQETGRSPSNVEVFAVQELREIQGVPL